MTTERQMWDGQNIYCNPPFSQILEFLLRFLFCKQRTQQGTSALFVIPVWGGPKAEMFWKLITQYEGSGFQMMERFPEGTQLFASPNQLRGLAVRKTVLGGPTRWPVPLAVWVSPAPLEVWVDLMDGSGLT